jgi:hypothetical protein
VAGGGGKQLDHPGNVSLRSLADRRPEPAGQ